MLSGSSRPAALAVLACAALGSTGAAPLPPAGFERVFAAAGEPPFLHAIIFFTTGGRQHRLELWRDHDHRIRRTTDARVTTLATRTQGAGYDLIVLDHARRTSTRISRDNLYRIGSFTDWFDLGHGLRHPRGPYRLVPTSGTIPATLPATTAPCRWYDLSQPGGMVHLCWDERNRLPLLITNAAWVPAWRIVSLDHAAVPAGRFSVNDRGYIRNDADRDVEGD